MKFGTVPIDDALGTILAHSLATATLRLKKGHLLSETDLSALKSENIAELVVARLDPDDVGEDEAASALSAAAHLNGMSAGPAATGRVNIYAAHNGLFRVERSCVDALNRIDPAITFACLNDRSAVNKGDMVATIKIIPFAVNTQLLKQACVVISDENLFSVSPFRPKRVLLVATQLPSLKSSVMDKTRTILEARLSPSASTIIHELRVSHTSQAVAQALRNAPDHDLAIVFGASAMTDACDVIPAAIENAGGELVHVGMPVDPGNLLVLGTLAGRPVIGAPGCARSPKENGFDWVLHRLLVGETPSSADLSGMGVGGLLMDIPSRPLPRAKISGGKTNRLAVAIVLLAAGKATRMGDTAGHKLLAQFDGEPLIRRMAARATASNAAAVHVVTGFRNEAVSSALNGLDVVIRHNSDYSTGMASSIRAGVEDLASVDGVMIALADMPGITGENINRLIESFCAENGRAIVRASSGKRRGNPVILPASALPALKGLTGDIGARDIIESGAYQIIDVDIGAAASLDVDTPDAVRAAGGILEGEL